MIDGEKTGDPSQPAEPAVLSMADLLDRELHRVEQGIPKLPTGFARLDAALGGGLAVPSLNIIGAGPKSLKSTLCAVTAERHAANGGAAFVLDVENGPTRFLRRMLCRRAGLAPSTVAAALRNPGAPAFATADEAHRWRDAQAWVRGLAVRASFRPPVDLVADLKEAKSWAGSRPLLVLLDNLQKLPGDLDDRRATVDGWIRLLERLRYDLPAVILLVSEIRRGREGYAPREDAFKESGGIEYAADLAVTLTRAAADEDGDEVSTLRVELARDTEDDPRGEVASYRPVRPFYGIEEVEPVAITRTRGGRRGPGPAPVKRGAAEEFLRALLADGAEQSTSIYAKGGAEGFSETTLRRALKAVGAARCTVRLRDGWKLPSS